MSAIAESTLEKGLLYAGTDKGLFWVKQKDKTWTERSEGLPAAYVISIVPSSYSKSRVYIAMSGMNYDDFGIYLFRSEDYGKTWQSMKGNLPAQVAYVVKEDPFYEEILYAGMYRGVYISTNRGESWSLLGENMPTTAISDIEIDENSKELVTATHGRGIYKISLSAVYEILDENTGYAHLFDILVAELPQYGDTHGEVLYQTATKLPIRFWIPQSQKVKLKVQDEEGETQWEYAFQADKGLNEYRWDLITESEESDSPYFIHYNKFLREGKYQVIITTPSDTLHKAFKAEHK